MNLRSTLLSSPATASERARLARQSQPVLDPEAQDYAAWRMRTLRRSCLAVAVSYALDLYAGNSFATVRFGIRSPTSLQASLESGLSWYLRALVAVSCLLLLTATARWRRPGRSCRLARWAWVVGFLGPMPLFLIPYPRVLQQSGVDAVVLASNVIRGILLFYVPQLFAMLPALVRASLVLKRFLPESALPGVLIVVAAPLQSLIYVVLLCILVQIAPRADLVLGVFFLAVAPLVWLARARTLTRPAGAGASPLRFERLVSSGFSLIGSSLILGAVAKDADLDTLILQNINVSWILSFMAGVLASRAILTVILVDGMLAMLYHAYRAEHATTPAEAAERLGRTLRSLGAVLSDFGPSSAITDEDPPGRADSRP